MDAVGQRLPVIAAVAFNARIGRAGGGARMLAVCAWPYGGSAAEDRSSPARRRRSLSTTLHLEAASSQHPSPYPHSSHTTQAQACRLRSGRTASRRMVSPTESAHSPPRVKRPQE